MDRTLADRYRLIEPLGAGAVGQVFVAEDTVERSRVAVKLIRPEHPDQQTRIDREIGSLRRLRMPGVVRLLDDGVDGPDRFIVMDLVRGRHFPGRPGPHAWDEVALVATRLLETVGRVHAASVLHRDLKPANVLVTEDHHVVLLDFGLARSTDHGGTITRAADVVGTLRYVSPEQLDNGAVDARSDLYAVGVMLYEALAGRPPHPDQDPARLVAARLHNDVTPLRHILPELPPPVSLLVDRLLRRAPDERPRTAGEALALLSGDPTVERRRPLLPRLGSRAHLDKALDALADGHSVDVWGPRGSGRTRLLEDLASELEAAGMAVHWVGPGQALFESLRHLIGVPAGDGDPYQVMEVRLVTKVGGAVLLADNEDGLDRATRRLLDRTRGRIRVVRVHEAPDALRLRPLGEQDLRALFHGPDRVLHLREDAARELFARTAGLPSHVAAEVSAWASGGLVTWDEGRLRITRDTLDRLAGGLRAASPVAFDGRSAAMLDRPLQDLLAWVAVAGEAATVEVLAAAMRLERWEVALEIEGLEEEGAVAVDTEGRVRLLIDPGSLSTWTQDRRRQAHGAVAAVLPEGADGRLGHLLNAQNLVAALEEATRVGIAQAEAGRSGSALAILQIALGLARQVGGDEVSLLAHMVSTAAELDSAKMVEAVAYEARRCAPSPEGERLQLLLSATLASARGEHAAAESLARGMGPLDVPALELERQTILVRSGMNLHPHDMGAWLAGIEPLGTEWPAFRARWFGWVGHYLRWRGCFLEAAWWHARSTEVRSARRQQRVGMYNSLLCTLDALQFDGVEQRARELVEVARSNGIAAYEMRAESLLRDVALRLHATHGADHELVAAAEQLQTPAEYMVLFTESVAAWRAGDQDDAIHLASRCRAFGLRRGHRLALLAGELVVRACGGEGTLRPDQIREALAVAPGRLRLQFLSLYACTLPVSEAEALMPELIELYGSVPVHVRDRPLELCSANEALSRARLHLAQGEGLPSWTSTPKIGSTGSPKA